MKSFTEALADGFKHVTSITDPELIKKLRAEGVLIDSEGIYSFEFGDKKEYLLNIEPISEVGMYRIMLYKNKVVLTEPLYVKGI